jgi:hypothetical protein
MELTTNLVCPCNGKTYKSPTSLKAHQKTQGHAAWQQGQEQKDILINITRLTNENGHLRRLNVLLMERISELEGTRSNARALGHMD